MAISIKHLFQSAKGDPADTTLVRPTNWNAEHIITLAANSLLGRSTAGAGAVEEVPCGSQGRAILAASDAQTILTLLGLGAFTTGDIKPTLKTTADTGWVMCDDGTIGDATSGATTRADADTADLYELLWTNVSDTYAPVTGGRGAGFAADYAAHKPIALTKMLGRALAAAGAGSGLTSRALGLTAGAETKTLAAANIPALTVTVTDPGHEHSINTANGNAGSPGQAPVGTTSGGAASLILYADQAGQVINDNTTGITAAANVGSANTAIDLLQPSSFVNFMVKL